jgi:hypothetical protein
VPWIKAALTLVAEDPEFSCLAEQDIDGPVIEIEACDERVRERAWRPPQPRPRGRRQPAP